MDLIDWDARWKAAKGDVTSISRECWGSSAPVLRRWMADDGYIGQFVKRVRLMPEWTVLDVGCGPGDISMQIARRCRHVTAMDISTEMLRIFRDIARQEGVSNVSCVQRSWDEDSPDDWPGVYDVVIASRSLGTMASLSMALARIDKAAGRYAYVTLGDGLCSPLKKIVCDATGRENSASPGYIYAYNMLYQMGIRANVEFLEGRSRFKDMEDVVEYCRWMVRSLDRDEEKAVKESLSGVLVREKNGSLEFPYNDLRWALIWWKKQVP